MTPEQDTRGYQGSNRVWSKGVWLCPEVTGSTEVFFFLLGDGDFQTHSFCLLGDNENTALFCPLKYFGTDHTKLSDKNPSEFQLWVALKKPM